MCWVYYAVLGSYKNIPKKGYHHFIIAWLTKEKYRDRRVFEHLSHNLLAAVDSVQQSQLSKAQLIPPFSFLFTGVKYLVSLSSNEISVFDLKSSILIHF